MKKVVIYFSIISIFLCACMNTKVNNDEINTNNRMHDFFMLNILNSECFNFPSGLELLDIKGERVLIDSVFFTKKLVLCIDYSCCDNCIFSELKNIRNVFSSQDIQKLVVIGTYENVRSILLVAQKFDIDFPIYFLPIEVRKNIFPSSLTQLHNPFLFIVDRDLRTHHIFIPSLVYPQLSIMYYNNIKEKIISHNQLVDIGFFHKKLVDAGRLKVNNMYPIDFYYTNTTDKPILFNDIQTTCGCTVPFWSKKPILPKETSKITVKFKPQTIGFHVKKIFVYTNELKHPVQLTIKAMVGK